MGQNLLNGNVNISSFSFINFIPLRNFQYSLFNYTKEVFGISCKDNISRNEPSQPNAPYKDKLE